jgi:hypothetical protein
MDLLPSHRAEVGVDNQGINALLGPGVLVDGRPPPQDDLVIDTVHHSVVGDGLSEHQHPVELDHRILVLGNERSVQ